MHGAETVARGLLRVPRGGGKGQGGSGEKDAGLHRLSPRSRELMAAGYYAPGLFLSLPQRCAGRNAKPRAVSCPSTLGWPVAAPAVLAHETIGNRSNKLYVRSIEASA